MHCSARQEFDITDIRGGNSRQLVRGNPAAWALCDATLHCLCKTTTFALESATGCATTYNWDVVCLTPEAERENMDPKARFLFRVTTRQSCDSDWREQLQSREWRNTAAIRHFASAAAL